MKILKIFGIVVGIHLFALILIFANPGCSSTTKAPPVPSDTVRRADPAQPISVPYSSPTPRTPVIAPAPITFNPDAPAMPAAPASGADTVRYTPTRPGTPVAGTLVSEPVADVTPAITYTVKSGDSLWSVAKKHHLSVAELAAANQLSANAMLHPGKKLVIPSQPLPSTSAAASTPAATAAPKAAESAPAAPRAAGEVVKHTVKSGETLGSIARHYGVRQGDIAVANSISDPAKIRAGMELLIPGWQAPSAKSGKAPKAGAAKAPAAEETPAAQPAAPATPPPVPIIRIDESPITPAPRP